MHDLAGGVRDGCSLELYGCDHTLYGEFIDELKDSYIYWTKTLDENGLRALLI